jgi:predicted O-linked N-acetylglucosamine transferase (SPINDLY family)
LTSFDFGLLERTPVSSQGNGLARAQALAQAGDFALAEKLYEQVLRVDPQQASAWHQLGLVVYRRGRIEEAAECLSRAVSLDPSSAAFQSDLGTIYRTLGRLDEALECFQQTVERAPELASAHYNLGVVLQDRGDHVGARLRLVQALRLAPQFALAWNHLGISHQHEGQLNDASQCFEKAIALVPRMAEAHFNLGNVRLAQNRLVEAAVCYARALELRPRFVEALNNLGTSLCRMGRLEQARHAYETVLKLCPTDTDARNNLGAILSHLGRHAEAEACYRRALDLNPHSAIALSNLAGTLQSQMRLDEAERLLRESLALDPHSADALGNLANVLAIQGRTREAAQYYRQSIERRPDPQRRIHAATMLPPIYESAAELQSCRKAFEANVSQLVEAGVVLDPSRELAPVNFLLAYQGQNDRDLARGMAGLYRIGSRLPAPHFPMKTGGSDRGPLAATASQPAGQRPIRIGFLSRFLRDHTIGDLTKGLIAELSRSDFCVTVFLIGETADATVALLRERAQAIVTLPENVTAARQIVADAGLDILVYPDVGMDPVSHTLAFSRLAHVQCAMWGHPVTTGIPAIDHFISSELIEPPDAADHYTENLVALKSLPTYYYRPKLESGAADAPPAGPVTEFDRQLARREFALPGDSHLYVCPQSLFKFHPDFDAVLAAILERDPTGRLVLIEAPHRQWTEALARRFARTLGDACDRVQFVPRVDRPAFLRLLATADLVLDPLHFGGGNTSFQALGLGVPIVTLPGALMRGRVTAGCYRKMKIDSGVVESIEDYLDLAVRLGTDRAFNALVRAEINSRSAALFEDREAVRELEEFFKSAVRELDEPAAKDTGTRVPTQT